MLGRLSIRARLTAAFAAALVLVLGMAGLFVYLRVSSQLTETIDDGLQSRVGDLTALAADPRQEPPQLSGGLFEGEEGFSQILTTDGRVIASTLQPRVAPAIDPEQLQGASREPVLLEDRDVPGIEGEARVLAAPAISPDGPRVVVAGASTDDRDEALAGLAGAFLIGAPLALVVASGLGYLLARRALAPVEAMRRRAEEITLERSGERLPLPRAEDEIRELGETLNAMLDRLEAALERERVFVADASHELRTPLANLRAELELADRSERTPEELRGALHSAADEVDRLSRLAEDLLVIARSDQGRLPIKREPVEIGAVLGRVAERFRRRAGASGREIVVDAPADLRAELDVLRIEQALGNLTDNALRHGGGEVRLSAHREDGLVSLEVADHGPGFPRGFESEAFERFTRADHGRTRGGAGLGLAIVQAIALAHGGNASVASEPGDAATTLRIRLPIGTP
jgi:two-component system OmpR family sensor kinase